jgi:hypothetical protein
VRALGNPIRVCVGHVAALGCERGCLGVDLDGVGEMTSARHDGCAICHSGTGARPFRILRKCHHLGCYGRFHPVSVDDLNLGTWLAFYWQLFRRVVRKGVKA